VTASSPTAAPAEAQAGWQAEQQRLESKVRFLEGVIKTKDDQIDNLQMRVEVLQLICHSIWPDPSIYCALTGPA
jgi:hypothetical protein